MKVAIIDNYDSFVYNLVRYIKNEGAEVNVMPNDRVDYAYLDSCDAILLSPGPGIPSEAGDLLKIIEKYSPSKKILGVCLGHQAIGEYFGATLIQDSTPVHGEASIAKCQSNQSIYRDLDESIQVGRYHSWHICRNSLPETLFITSELEDGMVMGLSHTSLSVEGVQFHPESILTPDGKKMIKNWLTQKT